jgi:hypothetical protein
MKLLFILPCSLLLMVAGCKEGKSTSADAGKTSTASDSTNNLNGVIDSTNFTTIEWVFLQKDFGKIKEEEKLESVFAFKNTGNKPLIIESAKASCGCTVAEYTKEPVAPGGSGEVKATFDSKGKMGLQEKSVYVMANTLGGQSHELKFKVEVLKK